VAIVAKTAKKMLVLRNIEVSRSAFYLRKVRAIAAFVEKAA